MLFGEPHPFPERGSPTRLSTSGQQSFKGWSCGHSTCYTVSANYKTFQYAANKWNHG